MKILTKIRNCFRIKDGKKYQKLLKLRKYTKKYFYFTFYYKDPITMKTKITHHHYYITRTMQLERDARRGMNEKSEAYVLLVNEEFISFMNNGAFDTDNKTAKTTHIKPFKGDFIPCTREFLNKRAKENRKMYENALKRLKKNEQSN